MYRVTRLNPFSWAQAYTLAVLLIVVVVGLLFVVPTLLFMLLAGVASEEGRMALVGIPVVLLTSVVALLAMGVIVFLGALVQGAAFNWALGRMGGLEVDLALGPGYGAPGTATAPTEPTPVAAALTDESTAVAETDAAPPMVGAIAAGTELAEGDQTSPVAAVPAEPNAPEQGNNTASDLTEDLPPGGA